MSSASTLLNWRTCELGLAGRSEGWSSGLCTFWLDSWPWLLAPTPSLSRLPSLLDHLPISLLNRKKLFPFPWKAACCFDYKCGRERKDWESFFADLENCHSVVGVRLDTPMTPVLLWNHQPRMGEFISILLNSPNNWKLLSAVNQKFLCTEASLQFFSFVHLLWPHVWEELLSSSFKKSLVLFSLGILQ